MVGMAPPYSYLLTSKQGGQLSLDRPKAGQLLAREQANYVYKKVETVK